MILEQERKDVIKYLNKMSNSKLSPGTTGNISIRCSDSGNIAISPTGMEYETLSPSDIVVIDSKGNTVDGNKKPTSELSFHLSLYNSRKDIHAIVHTHSPNATTVACLGEELPPVHYMIACSGNKVPLAKYHTFGTNELADEVVEKIKNYNAVLMENHGVIALGKTIKKAYDCAESVEFVSEVYLKAKSVGKPNIIPDSEMDRVLAKFESYGQQ
jgi:L-fuculose-phosphate aldolase